MGTQRTREDSESGREEAGDRMKTEELTKIEGKDMGLNTQEWFTKDTQAYTDKGIEKDKDRKRKVTTRQSKV